MKQYVQESYNLYIDGQWVPSADGKTFKEYNPSNGDFLAEVSEATRDDVDKAVKAATKALESWKHTSKLPILLMPMQTIWLWWKPWITANPYAKPRRSTSP